MKAGIDNWPTCSQCGRKITEYVISLTKEFYRCDHCGHTHTVQDDEQECQAGPVIYKSEEWEV